MKDIEKYASTSNFSEKIEKKNGVHQQKYGSFKTWLSPNFSNIFH